MALFGFRSVLRILPHEQHDDRPGVHEDLNDADEMCLEHDIQGCETEHRGHQPERRGDRALACHERDGRRRFNRRIPLHGDLLVYEPPSRFVDGGTIFFIRKYVTRFP